MLLFSSWILGISLICLFPPIPEYHTSEHNTGNLSQDSFPEIHQRNSSQTGLFVLDFAFQGVDATVEYENTQNFRFCLLSNSIGSFAQIPALFNAWILFEAFFETW